MHKISVVIPLYNKAHTIVNTLKSVLKQTYKDFEVVIVDDGSTDDSIELINLNFNDNRIRIIRQDNQGVSMARNTGIKSATGEWISFLDADDLWDEKYLEYVNNAIMAFPESGYIICGNQTFNIIDNKKRSQVPKRLCFKTGIIEFFENPHVFSNSSATTIKKELIEHNSIYFLPGQRYHEDYTMFFQVAMTTKICYIGLPLVSYLGGVDGQATSVLDTGTRLKDGCLFRNIVIHKWIKTGRINHLVPIFMRYEIRHLFKNFIKCDKSSEIILVIDSLSDEYKKELFSKLELWIYQKSWASLLSLGFIYFTKLCWRMHGFPRVCPNNNH